MPPTSRVAPNRRHPRPTARRRPKRVAPPKAPRNPAARTTRGTAGEDRDQIRDQVRHARHRHEVRSHAGRDVAQRPPGTMKRYLIAGLLVWVPLGITICVISFLVTHPRPDAAARAGAAAPRGARRLSHPRLGRRHELRDPVRHGCGRRQLLRPATDPVVGEPAGAHPLRQVDLLVGEAGERHRAVRSGHGVPQGAARRVSASRLLDDRVPDRHAGGRRRRPSSGRAHQRLRSDDAQSRPAATS